jgi:septum formation protein
MYPLILASNSVQRKNILHSLDIPFTIVPADLDEKSIRDKHIEKQAEKIARAKAEFIANQHHAIIIAADTFCVYKDIVLEKPQSLDEARKMLHILSGKSLICYTGFCYIDPFNNINISQTTTTSFSCRKFDAEEIETYIVNFPVLTWSAAVSPAHIYGLTMFTKINGSLTAFTHGLPMDELVPLLETSGFNIRPRV